MNTTIPSSSPSFPPLEQQQQLPYIEQEFSLTFFRSIIQSFSLTLIAELGDKSFIMLIILQMKSNQITVFLSSLSVQLTMNICAAFVGLFIDYLFYKHVIDYVGLLCFLIYGLWLIGDSFHTTEKSFENELLPVYSNKESRLKPETTNLDKGLTIIPEVTIDEMPTQELNSSLNSPLLEKRNSREYNANNALSFREREFHMKSNVREGLEWDLFWTIAGAMALSECGDRTQLCSLIMAAMYHFGGVIIGSCAALITTVTLGVYVGSFLVKYLHERTLNFLLGAIFVFYAGQIFFDKSETV